jgi:hypothetical protein
MKNMILMLVAALTVNAQLNPPAQPQTPSNTAAPQQPSQTPQATNSAPASRPVQSPLAPAPSNTPRPGSQQLAIPGVATGSASIGVFDFSMVNSSAMNVAPFDLSKVSMDQVLNASCLNPDIKDGQKRVDVVLKKSKSFETCESFSAVTQSLKESFQGCVLISNLNNKDLWCPVCKEGQKTNTKCSIDVVYASQDQDSCSLCVDSSAVKLLWSGASLGALVTIATSVLL